VNRPGRAILGFALLALASAAARAQSVSWYFVGPGGGTGSGGGLTLSGTVGQCDIGAKMTGGALTVGSGYWQVGAALGGGPPVITANIDLANINTATDSPAGPASFVRCVTFDFYLAGACPGAPSYSVSRSETFSSLGHATDSFTIPAGSYACAMARDPLHTLRRTISVTPSGGGYTLDFTTAAGKALRGGNLNDDAFIDILDFGGLISRFGHAYTTGADTACGYAVPAGDLPTRHADVSGNANVGISDFSFVSTQFLAQRDADCCGNPLADGEPVTDISVLDLAAIDYEAARRADLNRDGRVNTADIAHLALYGLPRCPGDFDDDGAVTVRDIFTFLTNWFAGYPGADVNDDGHVTVQDVFDFLRAWFAGC